MVMYLELYAVCTQNFGSIHKKDAGSMVGIQCLAKVFNPLDFFSNFGTLQHEVQCFVDLNFMSLHSSLSR